MFYVHISGNIIYFFIFFFGPTYHLSIILRFVTHTFVLHIHITYHTRTHTNTFKSIS